MKKKITPFIVAVVFILIVFLLGAVANWIEKNKPSDTKADLLSYFGFSGDLSQISHLSVSKADEIALIVDNEMIKARGVLLDNIIYLPKEMVQQYLNSRFYWDENENLLLYTTPTEIIRTEVGSKEYSIGKNKQSREYPIVKAEGDDVYIAADFVQSYTNFDYKLSAEPNRMQIITEWGDKQITDVKKTAAIRVKNNIKSDILYEAQPGTILFVVEQQGEWVKVRTEDGFIGYIQEKYIQNLRQQNFSREFSEPEYTNINKNYTINMAWHQVTTADANNQLSNIVAGIKGVNTISPTWFSIADSEGNMKSIASAAYVSLAHRCGMEVWALVDNFGTNFTSKEVLSYTTKRERLINQLISAAIEFDLDGLNIDFESIPESAGEDFIQFIRELSTKCRLNGIVLSIDNYVPGYTDYYNRKEQGIVADYVIIMGYDEHNPKSATSGSVASIPFVRRGIEETLQEVPAEKVINAIPFYTRLWKEKPKTQEQINAEDANSDFVPYTLESEALGMSAVDKVIAVNGLEPVWDENTGQYYIEYAKDGITYKSWIEEERSIEEKLKLINEYKLAGVAAWKIGLEKSSIWDVILKYTN